MNTIEIINAKKQGKELSQSQIEYIVNGYTNGDIPDYQVSALLMAIRLNGMTTEETMHLTAAMVESGDQIDLSYISNPTVDKHSTGGVGDKLSLTVAPIVASFGISLAKMSGKGLGHTGGTIDKLEAIKGVKTELSFDEFKKVITEANMVIAGQTANLVPADKKLYALRDVTGTVDSIPLIAASIMSKKVASGAESIVLDVKVGSGAFMKSEEEAEKLARIMVDTGNKLGRKTIAVLTNMEQPIGRLVGNKLEVQEAYNLLKTPDQADADLLEITIELAKYLLLSTGKFDESTVVEKIKEHIHNGEALKTFNQFIELQGADLSDLENNTYAHEEQVTAKTSGYIAAVDSEMVGMAALALGAGRKTKDSVLDYETGIEVNVKVGSAVKEGDVLFTLFHNGTGTDDAKKLLEDSLTFSDAAQEVKPNVIKVVR